MTDYVDIFGSTDFHDNMDNSDWRLEDYKYAMEDTSITIIDEENNDDTEIYVWNETEMAPQLTESDPEERVKEADGELKQYFGHYGTMSAGIVFDYFDHDIGGIAPRPGWNYDENKTGLMNVDHELGVYPPDEWVASHELGHIANGHHRHVFYEASDDDVDPCDDRYPNVTFMYTPAHDVDWTCNGCSYDFIDEPNYFRNRYSTRDECTELDSARSAIHEEVN